MEESRFGHGYRGTCLSALIVAGLVATATAAPPDGVLRSRPVTQQASDLGDLALGDHLRIPLFDGESRRGTVTRRRERNSERFTLAGPLARGGTFMLAVNRGAVAGLIQDPDGTTYRLRARGVLEQLDPTGVFTCSVEDHTGLAPLQAVPDDREATPVSGPCDDGSVIDVLFVYTESALTVAGGVAEIEAEIDISVLYNNISYGNSLIETQWNHVLSWYLGPGNDPTLGQLTNPIDNVLDGVHVLRDVYGADQVALIHGEGGGVANGLRDLEPESDATAFCLNGLGSFPFVVSHEIGHNMGCCHAIGDGGGCAPQGGLLFEYSNGHRFTGDSGILWHTVMAYNPGIRIQRFSNPEIIVDGQPTGIPEGETGAADNVTTIALSQFVVSNWRCNDGICEDLDLPSDGPDCNENHIPDLCDIARGTSTDVNGNDVPDDCECRDFNGDFVNGTYELLTILGLWGQVIPGHPADYDGNDRIWMPDLLILLDEWGPCF